ncbi:hypothetical protein TcasGA2_TC013199 [Tribolium castaneum]|uniref:Uncharacterized protein n=1 Tax=Tribolium castaneum TaxID=7070 RepID=D6WMY3_TRICA|nr:hypothetical protein TcasGA2_TC013199 [Tribolium castaneum]
MRLIIKPFRTGNVRIAARITRSSEEEEFQSVNPRTGSAPCSDRFLRFIKGKNA